MEINNKTLKAHYILYIPAARTYDGRSLYAVFGETGRRLAEDGDLPRFLRVNDVGEWTGHSTKYIDNPATSQGRMF